MSLNRREMLRLGAMGAAGAILSSAASSSVLPSVLTPATGAGAPVPPTPFAAQPLVQPSAPGGINPQLFARAKAALDQHQIRARDWMGVVDFSIASRDPRFHVVDLRSGEVESFRVAHGAGSDPRALRLPRALLQRFRLLRDARTAPTRPAIIITASTAFR